jgi:DNA repair protein SbcD/Mre11
VGEVLRILFVADSHLGLDLPAKPRIERRRRGHDFLANHEAALAPALAGEVDVVVHGGDVFDRPRVPASLAHQAYAPLLRVAKKGVPVFLVPGNHERARLPHARFLAQSHLHVFDRPRTFTIDVRGTRVALAGFPFERRHVRSRFRDLLDRTGWQQSDADLRLLCIHHCVEGATVGPGNFTFTSSNDVIRGRDIPAGIDAVLSGHIHRHQVLTRCLSGRPLPAPVLYPGSIERTSTAEIGETKGYLVLEFAPGSDVGPLRWEFRPLPARPMLQRKIAAGDADGLALEAALRALVAEAPADAVLTIRIVGDVTPAHFRVISPTHVRTFAPPDMNLNIVPPGGFLPTRGRREASRTAASAVAPAAARARAPDENLLLDL